MRLTLMLFAGSAPLQWRIFARSTNMIAPRSGALPAKNMRQEADHALRRLLAEIDVAHLVVGQDVGDVTLDQHRALVEHGDGPGDAADELHVVLDHDQGVTLVEL